MKLPNSDALVTSKEKIAGYLLNPLHPDNGGKAAFFVSLGFDSPGWDALATALRRVAVENDIAKRMESPHGTKYIVDGEIRSPSGKTPFVRTIWIVDTGYSTPRLVTAYPHQPESKL